MKKYVMACLLLLCGAANAGRVSAQPGVRYPYATVDAAGNTVIVCRDYKGGVLPKYLLKPAAKQQLVKEGLVFAYNSDGVWLSDKFRVAKNNIAETRFIPVYCRDDYYEASDGSDRGSWRLPTITELRLIAIMHFNNRINIGDICETRYDYYWTATSDDRGWIMCVARAGLYESVDPNNNKAKIRCVRDVLE